MVLALLLSGCAGNKTAGLVGNSPLGSPPLYYVTVGDGRPVVIVLHGGPGLSHDYLRPEWDRLAEPGRRVVYYDQRGCGRSGARAPYGWREDVSDLDRVVDHVSPNHRVVVAGSSWGSWLALLYTQAHPERVQALVLSGTPGRAILADRLSERTRRSPPYVRADSVNRGLIVPRRRPPDSTDTRAADPALVGRLTRPPQLSCPDAGRARRLLWDDVPSDSMLATVRAPALFVWGQGDWTYRGGRSIVDGVPGARAVVMEGLGHDPWIEAPDAFFAEVEAFLRGLTTSP